MENTNQNLFQVNLKGIISLLSEHIYSNPGTFVRELLQNSIDAITAIKNIDESYQGVVETSLGADRTLCFTDNGIGLKEEEILRFLTVIGESSKRDVLDADDFIGKFGIGLLSCFVVSNEIVVESRSAMGKTAVRWCGKVDGTYTMEALEGDYPIGTKVILIPKKEWYHLFEYETFKKHLQQYGNILPYPIYLQAPEKERELVNEVNPVWLNPDATKKELLEYGKNTFHSSFLDVFRIRTEQGKVEGVIYILPYKTQFSGKGTHKVYLKRMFLSDEDCRLLPPWAFFVKCVVNAGSLQSTASRESLVNNDELRSTQKEVGIAIKNYLKGLVTTDRERFDRILSTHFLHIKAIATEDNDLLKLYMDYLPFETNKGVRNFGSIRQTEEIYYTSNLDDFKQVRRIAGSQGTLVVNAAYTFDETLLKKIERMCETFRLQELTPALLLKNFTNVNYNEQDEYRQFEKRCEARLKKFSCICQLKHFTPEDTPVIFIAGEKGQELKQDDKIKNPLAGTLGAFSAKKATPPTLCFNVDNELVQTLVTLNDGYVFDAIVDILYVQSLLLGKYPVNKEEMYLFNESLYQLVIMGMDNVMGLITKK